MGKLVLVENVLDWQIPPASLCLCHLIVPTLVWLYEFLHKGLTQDDDLCVSRHGTHSFWKIMANV